MRSRSYYFEIFLVSLAAILLEISLTRIFSFKVYYFFTYLIIGLCLLGLGTGGILLATSERLRNAPAEGLIPKLCVGAGAMIGLAYAVVAPAPLNPSLLASEPIEILKLAAVFGLLTFPFVLVGLVVSTILSNAPGEVDRLYGADLLGAALGCALCVPLLSLLTPPRCVILSAILMCAAGLRHAGLRSRTTVFGVLVLAGLLAPLLFPSLLPEPVADVTKHYERYKQAELILDSIWNPVFRIDVAKHPSDSGPCYCSHW